MPLLLVAPFDTVLSGSALNELIDTLAAGLGGIYTKVVTGEHGTICREDIVEIQGKSGIMVQTYRREGTPELENKEGIFSRLPFQQREGDLLSITDYCLMETVGPYLYMYQGLAHTQERKALVSTAEFINDDPRQIVRRASVASLHEIGHLLGLQHHLVAKRNGLSCPMTESQKIKELHCLSTRDTILLQFDLRDTRYCDGCMSAVNAVYN